MRRHGTIRGANRQGFALMFCLFALVVLSVLSLVLLQAAALEKRSAMARANAERARLISEGAISHATDILCTLIRKYPDAATAWQIFPDASLPTEGTVLHFRSRQSMASLTLEDLPEAALPSDSTITQPDLSEYAWPLISGAIGVPANKVSQAFANALTKDNSTDLNRSGRMGALPGAKQKPLRAQWIEILRNPDLPRQLDRGLPDYNPPVGRYAFWIEDESFRVNLETSTDAPRRKSLGKGPSEIPLQGILRNISNDPTEAALAIGKFRERFGGRLPSFGSLAFVSASVSETFPEDLRFLSTIFSAGHDVMRSGARRVNVNAVFSSSDPPRSQMDRVIRTITYPGAAPEFGQRFYRDVIGIPNPSVLNALGMVSSRHAEMYLQRIAANLKDYIDGDAQPTIVEDLPGFPVRPAKAAISALEPVGGGNAGANPAAAIGKENVPRLQEYAIHARLFKMDPPGWSLSRGSAEFDFTLDHYLEFWNMGTRDIVLSGEGAVDVIGQDAVLTIYNQPSFGAPGGRGSIYPAIPEGRRFSVALKHAKNAAGDSFRIRAGACAVLTTDPKPNKALLAPGAEVFVLPVPDPIRRFRGTTTDYSDDKTQGYDRSFNHTYRVVIDARSNQDNDYATSMFLGNGRGLIESFCALPIVRGKGYALSIHAGEPGHINSDTHFVRGGNLRGNSTDKRKGLPASTSGDPRSLNEQLEFSRYESGNVMDSTRFYWNGLDNGLVPARSSMGLTDSTFLQSALWPDPVSTQPGAHTAPVWIKNAALESIGELGHLYDPARVRGTASRIEQSRGGGRSLRIGQPERWHGTLNPSGLWDGEPHSASRTWTAWRLADLFTVSDAFRIPGIVNPNGVCRDNGLALRALLEGFQYRSAPEGGRGVAGKAMTENQMEDFVQAVMDRFKGTDAESPDDDRVYWERGEISEAGFLEKDSFAGVSDSGDRGREEIIRRVIEMLAPRGSVFRVHAIGQAIALRPDESVRILATREITSVIELEPDFENEIGDAFDPSDKTETAKRFAPPSDYRALVRWQEE